MITAESKQGGATFFRKRKADVRTLGGFSVRADETTINEDTG